MTKIVRKLIGFLVASAALFVNFASLSLAETSPITSFYEAYDSRAADDAYFRCVEAFGKPSQAKRACTNALVKNAELFNLGKKAIDTLEGLQVPNEFGLSQREIRQELKLTKEIVSDLYETIAEIYAWRGTNLITVNRDDAVRDCEIARRMVSQLNNRDLREFIASLCF